MAFKNEGAGSVGAQAQNPEIEEQEESRSPKKRKDNVALTFKNHLLALGYTAHQGMIAPENGQREGPPSWRAFAFASRFSRRRERRAPLRK